MKNHSKFSILGAVLALASLVYFYVPPPKPAQAQFLDQSTYGGTSGGSANVQTISIANYSVNMTGVVLRFTPGFVNTGPTTINVSGIGAVALVRPSSIGNVALSGGELQTGELTCVTYNGTAYQLSCNVDMTPIGKTVEYRGSATPRGTLVEDGSCVSRTTYAPLFSVINTTYGVCDGSTTFGLPDSRGSVFGALDNQGANGAANRVTVGVSGCPATSPIFCGNQATTLTSGNLPSFTVSFSQINLLGLNVSGGGFNTLIPNSGGGSLYVNTGTFTGSNTAFPRLMPTLFGSRSIKY